MTNSQFSKQNLQETTTDNVRMKMSEKRLSELVERFYSHLTKDPYYRNMFAERNVDINVLKERQKLFIARLIHENSQEAGQDKVEQVRARHPFHTTPENAKIWMDTMRKTMDEIALEAEIKERLLAKMQFLMDKIIKK